MEIKRPAKSRADDVCHVGRHRIHFYMPGHIPPLIYRRACIKLCVPFVLVCVLVTSCCVSTTVNFHFCVAVCFYLLVDYIYLTHTLFLYLFLLRHKNILVRDSFAGSSKRAAIFHRTAINYLRRPRHSHTNTQATLFFTAGCGAIFNNLNIAPPAGPLLQRASVLRPFHHENWRFFKILPTRVNQNKAFSRHYYIYFFCVALTRNHTHTHTLPCFPCSAPRCRWFLLPTLVFVSVLVGARPACLPFCVEWMSMHD